MGQLPARHALIVLVLDTHAVLWYLLDSKRLSTRARTLIEDAIRARDDVHVSAISLVETIYLEERGRVTKEALEALDTALQDPASGLLIAPVCGGVGRATARVSRDAVPDMPDRIIAATALHLGAPLVTRDERLHAAGIHTIW